MDNDGTYLIELLRGLNELTHVKGLEQGLATTSHSVHGSFLSSLKVNCLELNRVFQMWSVQRDPVQPST